MRAASSPDLQVRFCIDRYPCRFPGPRSAGLSTSSTVLYQVGNVASSAIGDCQGSYRRGPMVPGHRHGPQAGVTKLNDRADVVLGLTCFCSRSSSHSLPPSCPSILSRAGWDELQQLIFLFLLLYDHYELVCSGGGTSSAVEEVGPRPQVLGPTSSPKVATLSSSSEIMTPSDTNALKALMAVRLSHDCDSTIITTDLEAKLARTKTALRDAEQCCQSSEKEAESPSPTHFVATLVMVMVGLWSLATFNRHLPDPHVEASFADASAFDLLVCGTLEMAKCLK
ncbi:hypothetical protein BHE74_00036494, partial [Ensete ventricosum]